jgi:hypothetical protein
VTERLGLDVEGLVGALARLKGRRLLATVAASGCVELVFEGAQENLVSIHCEGPQAGRVRVGAVCDPEAYASRNSRRRRPCGERP